MTKTCIKATGGKPGYYRRLSWERPAPTLMTNPSNFLCGCCHPDEHRPLSVEEYRRVQGFPDSWRVCGSITSQYRQIGNSVPVPLGEAVGKTILQHMHTRNSADPRPGFLYSNYHTLNDNIERSNMDTLELLNQVCAGMGNPPIPPSLPPESYSPAPDITCYRSDFRRLPIKAGSVDAVVTDIPWEPDWLPNVGDFAAWCARVLKPVVQYLVEHLVKEGSLVCDPLSGGWTTMEACWRTGRRFVGGDNRHDCLEKARGRFEEMQGLDEDVPGQKEQHEHA